MPLVPLISGLGGALSGGGSLFGSGAGFFSSLGTLGGVLSTGTQLAGIAGGVGSLFRDAPSFGVPGRDPFRGLITTPGFRFGEGTLVRRPGTEGLIGQTRRIGEILEARRAEIRPGFGRLTEARVQAIRDRRAQAVGNLRESLTRRNVLGASFAQDAIARTELEFAQEEERARAQSFLEELQLEQQNLKLQFETNQAQLAEEFRELQLATQFLSNVDQQKIKDFSRTLFVERQLQLLDARDGAQFLDGEQLAAIQNLRTVLRDAGFDSNDAFGLQGSPETPNLSFDDASLIQQALFGVASVGLSLFGPAVIGIPGLVSGIVSLTDGGDGGGGGGDGGAEGGGPGSTGDESEGGPGGEGGGPGSTGGEF